MPESWSAQRLLLSRALLVVGNVLVAAGTAFLDVFVHGQAFYHRPVQGRVRGVVSFNELLPGLNFRHWPFYSHRQLMQCRNHASAARLANVEERNRVVWPEPAHAPFPTQSMIKCVKCSLPDTVMKAGFVRGRQRYYCKSCEYHFTEEKPAVPERRRRQATIADVAKQVGVALSTVSRALNGHSDISAATRQAILDAARQLDYQPNLLAQSLKSRATSTIGVVIPDIERPFFATAVSDPARRGIPVVHFDRVCNEVNSAKVILDDRLGAYNVTEHLIEQGCRRIAILAGPSSLLISRQRQAGYLSALRRHGLPVEDALQVHIDFRTSSAEACLDTWLAMPEPPDAIFAINYTNAFDLMIALKRRGLRVPEDMAIVGFGDEFLANLIEPGLTTVDLHPYR
nr:hypothetical protein [Tanacetum cinerariifolium]